MRKFLIGCVFAALAAACGGDDEISFADLPDEFVNAQCDQAVKCETQPDDATCQASTDLDPGEIQTIQNAIDDGTVIFHSDAAGACVDFIAGQSCEFPGLHSDTDNPCNDMFEGTVAAGGACDIDIECAGATSICNPTDPNCDPDTACCPGTCMDGGAELPDVAIGGTCSDTTGPCVNTAYCKTGGAASGVCTALITSAGASCDELDACSGTMICNILDAAPTCEQPAASGASCDLMALFPCIDSRDFCDPAGTCSPLLAPGSACPNGDECIGFATCVNGTCVEDPGAGDTCVVDGEQECLGALTCTGGTCQFPPASTVCNQ